VTIEIKMENSLNSDQNSPGYALRLSRALKTYEMIYLCEMDFVTSTQLHQIRKDLRGAAEVITGANVIIIILSS
jgi:hypothetical protein